MKRILMLVDFFTRDLSPPASDETEREAARNRAATEIANRIRPYFTRVFVTVTTQSETQGTSSPGGVVGAKELDARGIDYFVTLDDSVGKFAGQGAESAESAGVVAAEFVELLRKERATDVYLLGATPSPSLAAMALASRSSDIRTWAIADTWPADSTRGQVQERLRWHGVTLIRSAEVDAGCCV